MKYSNSLSLISFILILFIGLGVTTYLSINVRNNETQNWKNQSFQQAQQITNIFLGWLDRENETLRGLASLFYGTEDISQEEFAAAVAAIEQTELSIRQLSIAFVFKTKTEHLVAGLAAGNEDLWQVNLPLSAALPSHIPIKDTIEQALSSPERPVIGSIFTNNTGQHLVTLAAVVRNSDTQGVLLYAVNIDTLLQGLNELHVPPGLYFALQFGDNHQINFAKTEQQLPIMASKTLRMMGVDKEWRFKWSVDNDYLGGPDTSMANTILFGGIVISLLLTCLAWLQAKQNMKITQKVIEKTSQLESAHQQLARSEKMASLGSLVAGVSHELNTPIGIALTASSSLIAMTKDLQQRINNNTLKKSTLLNYVEQSNSASELVESNIHRATELITSFKRVAVDQTSERKRHFDLSHSVKDIVKTLTPKLKSTSHSVQVDIESGIEMLSYPGPLGQVLTNFITNTLIHGFENTENGEIRISAQQQANSVILVYSDNGCGVDQDNLTKIFDPFYTSKLGKGGSGLGLNVVYNLCTGILGGDIDVESSINNGLTFTLTLPTNT